MEVFFSPYERPAPGAIFNPHAFRNPQLPKLAVKEKSLRFLSFRNYDLKKMIGFNPELQRAPWFRRIPNLDIDNTLMICFLRPDRIEPVQARSLVSQNVYGAVGHLLLKAFSAVRPGDMNVLEKRLMEGLLVGEETRMVCKYGYDISKEFSKTVFCGSQEILDCELQDAIRKLRRYVNSAQECGIFPVLQQGPFPQHQEVRSQSKSDRVSNTQKDSEIPFVHEFQQGRHLGRSSSVRDSWPSVEPLGGLHLQSQDGATVPGAHEMKGCNGRNALTTKTPGLPQSDVKKKINGLHHEGTEIGHRDLSTSSECEEKGARQEVDARALRKTDGDTSARAGHVSVNTDSAVSALPQPCRQGGGEGCGSSGMNRMGGTLGLPPHYEKSLFSPDQEEVWQSSGKAVVSSSGCPAAFSTHSTCPPSPSISQKNPDTSLPMQGDGSSTSTKTELLGNEKTLNNFQPADQVSSRAARDDDCGIRRKFFAPTASVAKAKTVLLLGAKGSGKTCLINAVANFILGVKSDSEKKVTVSDETVKTGGFSSTENITGYTFVVKDQGEEGEKKDVALTLIDTPGLNDSSGNEVRDHVDSLKTFLANAAHKELEIHAIALVVQAHLVRLTSSERLVMDHLKTLFGQDVSGHVVNLITFADNQSKPPVVEALDYYGMSTRHCFKFNNSVFCGSSEDSEKELDRAYWRTSHKSWKKCWKVVRDLHPLKTNAMKSVQKELYATNVRDAAMQEFHVEMKNFLGLCRKASSAQIDEGRRRVWDLAHVVFQTQLETEGVHYSSVIALVGKKYRECKEDSENQRDLHLLMAGVPTTLLEPAKAILKANMEIVQFIQDKVDALRTYRENETGIRAKVKSWFNRSIDQAEVADTEEVLYSIKNAVVIMTYESIAQLVERHTGALGSKLSVRSFLMLLKEHVEDKYRGMVFRMINYEAGRVKTRLQYKNHGDGYLS